MSVDVEQLTLTHKKAISTDDGIEIHSVPSLLSQLRESIYGTMGADGASRGFAPKLPIHAAALDLYTRIDDEITNVWVQAFKRIPGPERPEHFLSEWAVWAQDDTLVLVDGRQVYAKDVVAGWVRTIQDYLTPPRLAEIQAECVACGERWVYRMVDGETLRSSALKFHRDRDTGETLDARCEACGAVWPPSQFRFLAEAIGHAATTE